ncbi:MAG: hypothetical protein COB60_05950 [Flavobacteriaceae bacterium]|nr:MAG: hypothetical protein COB60_05950 [Flavobacteriaceae bacterium]
MDKKKIEQLKKKRLLHKETIRLKTLSNRISSQLNYLDEQSFDYRIHYEHENLDWISTNVAMRKRDGYTGLYDYQIDVDDNENCNSIYCNSDDSLIDKIREQFLIILSKESRLIVCYDGGDPEIEISVETLLSQPLKFFSKMETWILLKDKSWIIEYIREQEIVRFIQLQNKKIVLVKQIILMQEKE